MDVTEARRIRLGASPDTDVDVLRALARDPSVAVRASLAFNPALPPEVGALLATDDDPRVRAILMRGPGAMKRYGAVENLAAMVADASLRARARIAEAVRDLPDGPREIVLRLAYDPAVSVCEKVLRFSPVLTEDDLLDLIASGPPQTSLAAVATRREIGVSVSDAVAALGDEATVTVLLENYTAAIRDATLDALAAQSEDHLPWRSPLVHRPRLPVRSQRLLAEIVSGDLLRALAARRDLDPSVSRKLRPSVGDPEVQEAQARAHAMRESGQLGDDAMLDSLRRRDVIGATAMLATKCGVPVPVVERACRLGDPRTLVSLTWRAGFSPGVAVGVQVVMGRVPVEMVIRSTPSGDFALTAEEMRAQLSFLGIADPAKAAWLPRRLG